MKRAWAVGLISGAGLAGCSALHPVDGPRPGQEAESVAGVPVPTRKPMVTVNNCDKLVKITASSTAQGAEIEKAWINKRFPGAAIVRQSSTNCGRIPVDRVVFRKGSTIYTVLFDASSFFGKFGDDDLDDLLAG